jgi:tetratricopeptide (TPR) repeat protein
MRIFFPVLQTCLVAAGLSLAAGASAQDVVSPTLLCSLQSKATPDERIAACTTLLASANEPNVAPRVGYLLARADAQEDKGDLARAIADFNAAIQLDPGNATAFESRGTAFLRNGNRDRAIEDYNEAIRLEPNFALAYADRGAAYYFKKDYERAIKDYDEAIRLDPKRAGTFSNRGAAYKKLGRNDRALADENEAIRLDPTKPEMFDNRGLSYAHNRDYDRAIEDYNEAIRLKPQANFLTNRGDSYQFKGELDRAIADYNEAIRLNPKFVLAWNNRGAAFRKKGDLARAVYDYEQALRLNPAMDTAAENRDAVLKEMKRLASLRQPIVPTFDCLRAKKAVEKAICSDPELTKLDWDIDQAYRNTLVRLDANAAARLRRAQRSFIETRDRRFGRPDYMLRKEMEDRLADLQAGRR